MKKKGLDLEWQSADGAMTKAPLGGEKTGPNPTDRGKSGTKRSLLTEANGIPIGIAIEGANRHDSKLLEETLFNKLISVNEIKQKPKQENICLDKAYDSMPMRVLVWFNGYRDHIRTRGEEIDEKQKDPNKKPRRWVVERTHSWMNRFRRILIRWEKKPENYLAMLKLSCAYISYHASGLFG